MPSAGTLWTIPQQVVGKRILALAALGGITLDLPEKYTHYEDNKKPEFTSKFANGKIPALEMADGFCLFETAAISRYVAGLNPAAKLLGSNPKEAALIDQWCTFGDSDIVPSGAVILQMFNHVIPYNKGIETTMRERLDRGLTTLNTHLAGQTFFVGERLTLADVRIAEIVYMLSSRLLDGPARAKLGNLVRHFETVANQAKIKEYFGDYTYIEKGLQYVPPAKKKEEKPKEAPKPKAEKPKKEVEPEDDEDDIPKEEPKAKNPLDSLPKSSLNLEDFKRAYSNMDTRGAGGSLEWLYERFDKEGYSVWRVDFKYNEELTQTFMSSNQIGGFFNRLEASRKYLFGSVGVLGTANNSIISGVFIARGQEIAPVVDCAPDWESYAYTRIDPFGQDKEFFEAAMAWDLDIDGKKWADGKNFK